MSGGLWRDHTATPAQQRLGFHEQKGRRKPVTQADVLLEMLRKAREVGKAVELPTIMGVGIAQHGARFNEIRSRGFVVENEISRKGEVVRSRYWLRFDPELDGQQ